MKKLFSKITLAQNLVELCRTKGIADVVISPGSRNAPLTISFANNDSFNAYSIVDERSAAFFALGMAQRSRKPVALCCTSGSALLNYYPAVAEAFYSDIPLVVISADRPVERLDIGDGQTIRQKNVFENHILYSANLYSEIVLTEASTDIKLQQKKREAQRHNEREINLALNTAIEKSGPVHINVPFYEPLYETVEFPEAAPLQIMPIRRQNTIDRDELKDYAKIWNASKRKLILVGTNSPHSVDPEILDRLAKDPSVLVFAESTSNLLHRDFIVRIDNIIAPLEISTNPEEQFKRLQPDVLLTFGGMVVSKKVKAFLRNYPPQHHWHVDSKKALDTYFCLDKHFDTEPNIFFTSFNTLISEPDSDYRKTWLDFRKEQDQRHEAYLKNTPFSDLKAFSHIFKNLRGHQVVHFSNSSVIRYANLFTLPVELEVYCNRGTSGIDGSVSTAIGSALKSKVPTTLICGDLAFFYDSNALWNEKIPKNFKIILINNDGGGIFRILPGKKNAPYFHRFFETRHKLTAKHLAEMYGFHYQSTSNDDELTHRLPRFLDLNERPGILEIFTPTETNDKILLGYFGFVRDIDHRLS